MTNRVLPDDHAAADLIDEYADTWRLLLQYDEDRLAQSPAAKCAAAPLDVDDVLRLIADFKRELTAKGEASSLFGIPRDDALASILGSIEQTMFGEPLYRSPREKAAHLLYFVVKDHPFTDGNKRIASLLLLLYLQREGIEHSLSPQALAAVTLLVAQSSPDSKDLMVRLVANLLDNPAG